ncbi:c-type cytochrome [Variovorax sp. DXTD-1]|uniref:c-type cytochrome n=1 Tax=Variovorax sp. DXTD-1 TaxID=2495592 RepID=UPI000F865525|nr:c-type cytochrome [Variovorax sp. DXTD-1]RST48538.1 c-type cytochrome [Variovorax sp. DXTD-1]
MVAVLPHRAVCLFALLAAALLSAACTPGGSGPPFDHASSAQLERGRQLLAQYQCGSCHAIPEVQAARGRMGPTLAAFGRRSYIAGHVPNGPDHLVRWIVAPAALVPGTLMPAMGVSPDDARDMAAYLLSLE